MTAGNFDLKIIPYPQLEQQLIKFQFKSLTRNLNVHSNNMFLRKKSVNAVLEWHHRRPSFITIFDLKYSFIHKNMNKVKIYRKAYWALKEHFSTIVICLHLLIKFTYKVFYLNSCKIKAFMLEHFTFSHNDDEAK